MPESCSQSASFGLSDGDASTARPSFRDGPTLLTLCYIIMYTAIKVAD